MVRRAVLQFDEFKLVHIISAIGKSKIQILVFESAFFENHMINLIEVRQGVKCTSME
jgi:hypothetical protein